MPDVPRELLNRAFSLDTKNVFEAEKSVVARFERRDLLTVAVFTATEVPSLAGFFASIADYGEFTWDDSTICSMSDWNEVLGDQPN